MPNKAKTVKRVKKQRMLFTASAARRLFNETDNMAAYLCTAQEIEDGGAEARAIAKRGLALADSLRKAFGAV